MLYDAGAIPGGEDAAAALATGGHAREFLVEQYRHCKPILALGAASSFLDDCGVGSALASGEDDPGVVVAEDRELDGAIDRFVGAIAQHRHWARQQDPPAL